MSIFHLLSEVETQVIRLGEMCKLYNVVVNGISTSTPDEIASSFQYIQGSLEDISLQLSADFQTLHEAVMKNEKA
jgi:hypothetical protein